MVAIKSRFGEKNKDNEQVSYMYNAPYVLCGVSDQWKKINE